jgi:guanine deaminase
MDNVAQVITGTAFHTPTPQALEVLQECAIAIDADGIILHVSQPCDVGHDALLENAARDGILHNLSSDTYLIPGLVDLHIHASQWPQMGKALDAPLEDWLLKYTFPLEAKFADHAYATTVYDDLVKTLLAHGTTTAVYFGSVDLQANIILAESCLRHGQRALVGKVAMDHPETCPDYYRDASAQTAVDDTRAFIDQVYAMQRDMAVLVHPTITPRFIPSCTDDLLTALGELASETGCHVQTHCSESDWEVAHVTERLGTSDTVALDKFGLLTEKTVLAHSNFISDSDMVQMAQKGAAVAHCPLSNTYFANAIFPTRRAMEHDVEIGLGSDISGGFSPSIFDAARAALVASRHASSGIDPALPQDSRGSNESPLTTTEVFWMATKGGGEAISLPVGAFVKGYHFDALAITSNAKASGFRVDHSDLPQDIFEKLILTSSTAAIRQVWVNGVQTQ